MSSMTTRMVREDAASGLVAVTAWLGTSSRAARSRTHPHSPEMERHLLFSMRASRKNAYNKLNIFTRSYRELRKQVLGFVGLQITTSRDDADQGKNIILDGSILARASHPPLTSCGILPPAIRFSGSVPTDQDARVPMCHRGAVPQRQWSTWALGRGSAQMVGIDLLATGFM